MENYRPIKSPSLIYYRLITLWVLCEAMLGGVIHGLKIPVSGLVVGSCAIICICLIAFYIPQKGAILKATIIVAVFKMMLSPQAGLPAYFAVFFQGVMGEILFFNRRLFRLPCFLLAILGLLESGLQRIIVLTIVYGDGLWKAINDFINGLTGQKTITNYSWWICAAYVSLHLITGFFVGWWASVLPGRVEKWSMDKNYRIQSLTATAVLPTTFRKRRRWKKGLFIIWILLILLYVQSYFKIGEPLLPSNIVIRILVRSLIIVLSWIFLVGPLLKQVLHNWLRKKQSRSKEEIEQVLLFLPQTQSIIVKSWELSKNKKGGSRLKEFSRTVLVNALYPAEKNKIFILSGPIQSGKTSSIIEWSKGRKDVWGILTPIVDSKRVFQDIQTGEQFSMEAIPGESEPLSIGRYIFSKNNFEKAIEIIRKSITKEGWLVIDEIGPMELKGEGFAEVFKYMINNRSGKVLIVVREGLIDKVTEYFKIEEFAGIKEIESNL